MKAGYKTERHKILFDDNCILVANNHWLNKYSEFPCKTENLSIIRDNEDIGVWKPTETKKLFKK